MGKPSVLLECALYILAVDAGKTVFNYGMDCGCAEHEIHMGVICTLAAGFIAHAPVKHTGSFVLTFYNSTEAGKG